MSVASARDRSRDSAGGAFLDDVTLERLRSSADGPQCAAAWLAGLSGVLPAMRQGLVVLMRAGASRFEPLAVWPEAARPEPGLMRAVEACLKAGRSIVTTLAANEGAGVAVCTPVLVSGQIRGAVAASVEATDEPALRLAVDQLQWSAGWMEALVRRGRTAEADGLVTVIELMATALHHRRFGEAATATATELAAALRCERVAIGFLKGRHTRMAALSHSANFARKSNLVRAMEHAMDEAVDQAATVVLPEPLDAPERVIRYHAKLAETHAMKAVCTVPIAEGRRVIGALLLEREEPFDRAAIQLCEHAAALLGPALDVKRREDRWLPAKAWEAAGNTLRALVGPRHAGLKLGTLLTAAAVAFAVFATGPWRVTAEAVVEGRVQRAIAAPVAGYLAEAGVRAGDTVRAGQLLASLDTTELRLEKIRWTAERAKHLREYSAAMARKERASAQILEAQIAQADARLALIDQQLERMRVTAPFDGLVVSGDLSQALGAPVERGDVLFALAPLDGYRVRLKVDERDVGDVALGQTGTLALAADPDSRLPFAVTRLTPVSTAEEGVNYFVVEGTLDRSADAVLRPGMEGVGKIDIGERRLVWIWTRKAWVWAQMTLWSWWP